MTQIFNFVPGAISPPFTFSPLLDGTTYTANVTWNLFGQRWYIQLYDGSGNLIFNLPLIGSPDCVPISSLSNDPTGNVTCVTSAPHGYPINEVSALYVFNATPSYFDGLFSCVPIDGTTITWVLPGNSVTSAATATVPGYIKQFLNLLGGYFSVSVMEYWTSGNEIIVIP